MTLLCVPHAGAGASAFREWGRRLPDWLELRAVQLPGREERFREAPATDLKRLADELAARLQPFTDRPYAVHGHSMGALIAFEVARRLEDAGARPPTRVFLAACGAPHAFRSASPLHALPDDELVATLRRRGAVPEQVLDQPELMRLLIPILRADLGMCASYRPGPGAVAGLSAGISAFAGDRDPDVPVSAVAAWADLTGGSFRFRVLAGGHLFPADAQARLHAAIVHDLAAERWVAA
jgi:medium-chain acyl-[acyl-carrier-protein] hydrolase